MLKLPSTPISPTEFIEEWLPRALEVSAQGDDFPDLGIKFGVVLTGEGGGEWLITVQHREAIVAAGSRDLSLIHISEPTRPY